ncbi:efflux transporter outer membrane subunit [Sphingomonas abaci]|uniref:NodT family efflux transporter outer membrane factor (OMF) lipoprotein n=1 Tax=Sphingomonas abaci TaxID=237611 RepID=A0A7W7EZV3_9SPHN|nr:efflux transporter outer membrane subunit [Sphingomonas abaci]MBB4619651.1 NodT family efflux transporter outer membrane factor (OMF) lipoprotein [Sphingomonas abaci]
MPMIPPATSIPARQALAMSLLALLLAGCTVGPNFVKPAPAAPGDWTSWRSGDVSLRAPIDSGAQLPADWWRAFNDPVLDELERRAFAASPDLRTAALHVAQARVQRGNAAAQGLPQVNASGQVKRQRQSEYGAGTRLFDAVAGNATGTDRDALAELLGEPFTLYQTGLDASWEIDLWGKVRRSLEAADADVTRQAALLDLARLSLASDVARNYLDLRATQHKIALAREDAAALSDRADLLSARTTGGINNHFDLERQRSELQRIEAQLPALLAQEAAQANQIALLLGERSGALGDVLKPVVDAGKPILPDLALGLPSEIALRRPDIRAAEARLHAATANIGVAKADLYPSIQLGGGFSFESYRSQNLFDWASRTWSIGPSVSLPLFDGGRRKRVVQLRELEQKEAAVNYQQTVLQAWQEIDDALNAYAAEQQQNVKLIAQLESARAALDLASARYRGGIITWLDVIDSQRTRSRRPATSLRATGA